MTKILTLVASILLFAAMNTLSLNASDMKCGAGKCAKAMEAPAMKKPTHCEAKTLGKACACPVQVACTCKDAKNCTCEADKKAPKAAMKCGTGKCG